MTMFYRHWLTLLLMQWCFHISVACPSACVCKWKGGKQTVECLNKGLITIPDGMDPGTQVLEFSGNNLQILPRERFQRMGLLNLQRIYLSRCKLGQIDDRSFRGLTNLVELDLSENLLSYLPTETFVDYTNLMRLTVSNNPIKKLKARSFQPLSALTTLEISNCELDIIEDDAFIGLERLEWLKLDGNRLATIRGTHLLPASLHGIDLHHNPWHCDCKLVELHAWLLNYNIPHSIEPRCETPARLHDLVVKTLDVDDFACLPDVSPTTMYLEIAEGKNLSLLCEVSAVPEARVSWWFQGRVLQNDSMVAPGLHLYYFVEEGTLEKKSELFIFNANTEDNGTFVCVAENPAGRAQSNYTIRIIVREEVAVAVVLPHEYMIAIIAAIAVLATLIVVVLILLIIRCRRSRHRKRKRERSKVIALQNPEQQTDKSNEIDANNAITRMHKLMVANPGPAKVNGSVITERHLQLRHHEVLVRGGAVVGEVCASGCVEAFQLSPGRGGQERNPDLINDTESVGKEKRTRREEGDGEEVDRENSGHNSYQEAMENIIDEFVEGEVAKVAAAKGALPGMPWRDDSAFPLKVLTPMRDLPPTTFSTLPRRVITANMTAKEPYQHAADVHLSPGRFLDHDGYPIDFGLPKLPPPPPMALPIVPPPPHPSYYRTLPYNRGHNKMSQYPREAEYLPGPPYETSYSHEPPADIRYSVEGYPTSAPQVFPTNETFPESNFIPSPPAAYKSDAPTVPTPTQTDATVPSVATISPPGASNATWSGYSRNYQDGTQGGSKTSSESQQNLIESAINAMVSAQPDGRTQQESPDEGYEDGGTEM